MKVSYSYSNIQLESTIDFISKHNEFFFGQKEKIKQSILDHMEEMARRFPELNCIGTMGYTIMSDIIEHESIDHENNIVQFDILVDPGLGFEDRWSDEDYVELVLEVDTDESESV